MCSRCHRRKLASCTNRKPVYMVCGHSLWLHIDDTFRLYLLPFLNYSRKIHFYIQRELAFPGGENNSSRKAVPRTLSKLNSSDTFHLSRSLCELAYMILTTLNNCMHHSHMHNFRPQARHKLVVTYHFQREYSCFSSM